jgi:D-alanyl-D-alanine dipeptidase
MGFGMPAAVSGEWRNGEWRMGNRTNANGGKRAPTARIHLFAIRYALSAAFLLAFATQGLLAQDRPADFVDVATVVPGLIVEMRYAGSHNFTGRPVDGYQAPHCLLTRQAADALADVARDVAPSGLRIKVFDCYRPVRAVANFVRWARDLRDQTTKVEFYPDVDKGMLFRDGYIASHSGHSRGSTMDLTLAKIDGTELDMGTHFDFLSPKSWTADPTIAPVQHANRMLLAGAMRRHGFRGYDKEWWHFTLRGEPFPATYFDFPVQ